MVDVYYLLDIRIIHNERERNRILMRNEKDGVKYQYKGNINNWIR